MEEAYIGITGFKSGKDVQSISKFFGNPKLPWERKRTVMYGILSSSKRLLPENWDQGGTESPPASQLAEVASYVPLGSFPAIHYFTKNTDALADEVCQLFDLHNLYKNNICSAVQLNVAWPKLTEIENIMKEMSHLRIILQIPQRAMEGKSLEDVALMTSAYAPFVSYVLIDPSGGLGKEFDEQKTGVLLQQLHAHMPETRLGVAGGLSGDNVITKITAMEKYVPITLSFDAQGALRTPDKDDFILERVKLYVENALRI